MRLDTWPKMRSDPDPILPDEYDFVDETEIPPLIGDIYPEEAVEGTFDVSVVVGMDVIVYTRSRERRPWCGRVLEILPGNTFKIQWFSRRGRSNKFYASTNKDGSAYTTVLESTVVMFWEICEAKQESSFILSPVWMKKILDEYSKYDVE